MHVALLLAVSLAGWSTTGPRDASTSHVAVAPGPHPRVFAASSTDTDGGAIYRSDDGGSSWERSPGSPPVQSFIQLAVDPHDPDRVFAADFRSGFSMFSSTLYRSVDGGTTWTQRMTVFGTTLCNLAFDSVMPVTVYASYGSKTTLFRSDDGGETFTELPAPFEGAQLASAADGTLIAGAGFAIFVSRDRGATWTEMPSPVRCVTIAALAVDPFDAKRWYVGGAGYLFTCGDLARTDDGGSTWTLASEPGPVTDLAVDKSGSGFLYASTGRLVPSNTPGRALASADGGETWIDLRAPVAAGFGAIALPDDGSRIYGATGSSVYVRDFRRPRVLPPR